MTLAGTIAAFTILFVFGVAFGVVAAVVVIDRAICSMWRR